MITLNVLAVDDEAGMRSGIVRSLDHFEVELPEAQETIQFKVEETSTGEDAVALIQKAAPDILLLDYKLPGISGIDVLNQTVQQQDDMLTIMITAYASINTAITATRKGAYDFLPKPFTPRDLKHSVRKAATRLVLARKAKALEAANKRVRFEFTRVLGHELKAPIAAVSGYLYLLRDHILGDDVGAYDDAVNRSLKRLDQMRKLIVDLLDMTRLESGEKVRDMEWLDMQEVVASALELVETGAARRSITLAQEGAEGVRIWADRGELDMMLNNLVSNAVKYNRDNGSVTVALCVGEDGLNIDVIDTGIGMTPEDVDKLFGEFVRIKTDQTRNILGSGLGLSILKRLASLYGGEISVASEPDVGSTFSMRLRKIGKPDA
ncbi:MAG: response regulator [Verrucomicrobia bacterium]|nr:response regulator [Verrucomicrobiota bacterium]